MHGWYLRCIEGYQSIFKFHVNLRSRSTELMLATRSTLLRSVGLLYMEHLWMICIYLIQSHNPNWLWQVMWHRNYRWHHSTLSTRPKDSTSLVTSVKVSWLRPRAPKLCFENHAWLTHLSQLKMVSTLNWLTQPNSTQEVRFENYTWLTHLPQL